MGNCNGKCRLYLITRKISKKFRQHVKEGYKACRRCECFILTESNFCDCCGTHMATIPSKKSPILIEVKAY